MHAVNDILTFAAANAQLVFSYITGFMVVWQVVMIYDAIRIMNQVTNDSDMRAAMIAVCKVLAVTTTASVLACFVVVTGIVGTTTTQLFTVISFWSVLVLSRIAEVVYTSMPLCLMHSGQTINNEGTITHDQTTDIRI